MQVNGWQYYNHAASCGSTDYGSKRNTRYFINCRWQHLGNGGDSVISKVDYGF